MSGLVWGWCCKPKDAADVNAFELNCNKTGNFTNSHLRGASAHLSVYYFSGFRKRSVTFGSTYITIKK